MALRFFRKHRKWFMILVFGGVLGMVGWGVFGSERFRNLVTSLLGGGPGGEVVGRIGSREVTQKELGWFVTHLQMSGRACELWYRFLAGRAEDREDAAHISEDTVGQSAWLILAQRLEDPEQIDPATKMAWLALEEEACRFGFGTPAVEVERRLERLRSLGLTERDMANTVARLAQGRRGVFLEALRRDMTLMAYIQYLYEALGVPVRPELRRAFARQDARLKVRMAVFKAEDALDDVGEPAEDAILEYFNKYKQYLPGKGPDGIGYRIPAKVAVEYLVAEPDAFEDAAAETVTEESIEAYYKQHKDTEFRIEQEDEGEDEEKEKDTEADDEADADEDPEEIPGEKEVVEKKYRPLEEVREEIRDRLVRHEAEDLARKHLAGLVGEISTKRKGIDLRIWADGRRVRYVRLPDPLTAEELAEVEGLGGATRDRTTIPQAALNVVELVGPEKARLAVGEISEVYTGTDGKAYAFRVTDALPSREPKSLDEVRPAVVEDVRRAEAFRTVRERAKRLLEAAAGKGLETAAQEAKPEVETLTTDWFPRERFVPYGGRWISFAPTLPEVGSSPALVAKCFEMVRDGRERTLVTLGDKQMVVVAEVIDRKAPREAGYARFRPLVVQRLSRRMAGRALMDLLDPASIRRRWDVSVEISEKPEKEDDPSAEDGSTAPEPDEATAPEPDQAQTLPADDER